MRFTLMLLLLSFPFLLFAQFDTGKYLTYRMKSPNHILNADMDGDGDLDVVVVASQNRSIVWFENLNNDGNFGEPNLITAEYSFLSAIAIDADADGDIDVIGAANGNQPLRLFENVDGAGQDWNSMVFSLENATYSSVYGSDIDGDEDLDLVAVSYDDKLLWFENLDGQGTFSTSILIMDDFANASEVVAIDFDNDGDEDIFTVSNSGTSNQDALSFFENLDGQGTFGEQVILATVNWPTDLTFVDVDGDGDLDVLSSSNYTVIWGENLGGGNFASFTGLYSNNEYGEILTVASTDFDNDGDVDVVYGTVEAMILIKNLGNGDFGEANVLAASGEGYFQSIAFADFNNDNFPDVVAALRIVNAVVHLENSGGTGEVIERQMVDGLLHVRGMHFADFDNDDNLDILLASKTSEKVVWHSNEDGAGQFGHQQFLLGQVHNAQACAGDFNGDGHPDVVAISGFQRLSWFDNASGDGTFATEHLMDDEFYVPDFLPMLSGDVDADGDIDIVMAGGGKGWYDNLDGQGTFSAKKPIAAPVSGLNNFELVDFNNDNNLDFLGYNGGNDLVAWVQFNSFTDEYEETLNIISDEIIDPEWVKAADLDGDADLDVIVLSDENEVIWWLENNMGIFSDPIPIAQEDYFLYSFQPLDVDNDGDIDIVSFGSQTRWYENDGTGTFSDSKYISDTYSNISNVADIDADGDIDLFGATSAQVIWYENYTIDYNPRIKGTVFFDENENGIFDASEIGLNEQIVEINPNPLQSWTTNNGEYNFRVTSGTNNLFCEPTEDWQLTTPQAISLSVDNQSITTQDFGLIPNGTTQQAEINLTSGPTRCGFTVPFWLTYNNLGNQQVDGIVTLALDPQVTFVDANPLPTAMNGNSLSWDFSNLNPTYSNQIVLYLEMSGVEALGDFIEMQSQITLLDNAGNTLMTNEHQYTSQINCAYDPNDKSVIPNIPGNTNYTLFGDTLNYTVRFQNTGTDTAFNVRIEDVLDRNLDKNTFRVIAASHDYVASIDPAGKVTFQFDDILLPDSIVNEVASHGFIQFEIKVKDDLAEGTLIRNDAGIFFDFNPPIITNTVINKMVSEFPLLIHFDHPACADADDGFIEILHPENTFSYQWSNDSTGTAITELGVGEFQLSVFNNEQELVADTIIALTAPEILTINTFSSPETNQNADGSAAVEIDGGIPPYFYEWNTSPIQTSSMAINLATGTYQVSITDSNGCQKIVTIEVDNIVGINDELSQLTFEIAPNPATTQFFVKIAHPTIVDWVLNIQTVNGKVIKTIENNSNQSDGVHFEIAGLPAGIYFANLKIDGAIFTKKLVIIN